MILIYLVLTLGCDALGPKSTQTKLETQAKTTSTSIMNNSRISIMTYNLENLFDTLDDPGKDDKTYLPSSKKQSKQHKSDCKKIPVHPWKMECLNMDWSPKIVTEKLKRIASVIKQVNGGKGPDILLLQEVENINILETLRKNHLQNLGYKKGILLEGPDSRGIDTAILTRLDLDRKPKLHIVPYKAESSKNRDSRLQKTRGILEAPLKLPNGQVLHVFAVHLHSAGKPTYVRIQGAKYLNELLKKVPKTHLAIAGGDFNINQTENSKAKIYEKILAPLWHTSHLVGCKNCRGSSYYHKKRQWSFLDALLFAKEDFDTNKHKGGWSLDKNSIKIANQNKYQNNKWGSPARFDPKSDIGVSDHWPVIAEIIYSK